MIRILHSVVDSTMLGQEIKKRWAFSEPFRCELLTRGMNDVYLIQLRDQRYAARVWRADKQTEDTALWELEFLQHLKNAGIPVIAAIPDSNGELLFSVEAPEGKRQVCLFNWAYGEPFFVNPKPELAHKIGGKVAEMHIAGKNFIGRVNRPIDFPGEIRRKLPALAARLDDRPADRKFYEEIGELIADRLEDAYAQGVPYGPIHGDVHINNIFVTPDDRFTILDFDTCGEAHLMHDVMSLAWANTYYIEKGNPNLTTATTEAFMEGYKEARSLENFELSFLPLFMASKELSYMCGMSDGVKYVGHMSFGPKNFEWILKSVRRNAEKAGLL